MDGEVVIVGAGPTGLGAAWRMEERRNDGVVTDWMMVDEGAVPGGMARSDLEDGFTWDLGGHVLFSHYSYFDHLLDELVDEWCHVMPIRGAWMFNRFIPYPVQRNLWHFPEPLRTEVVAGLRDRPAPAGDDFESHLLSQFGQALHETFMLPLNRKMWSTEPELMSRTWTTHRSGSRETNVPSVDVDELVADITEGRDRPAWSDDTRIRYPATGGTGTIWMRLAAGLPSDRLRMGTRVTRVESRRHRLELDDGSTIGYDHLVSSMPLDVLLRLLTDQTDLTALASQLRHSSTTVVGIGLRGTPPPELREVCSLYLPDPAICFWRLTVLSNYSRGCVPGNEPHWSLLCEINSDQPPDDLDAVVESTLGDLTSLGFIERDCVVTTWRRHLGHGYPVPLRNRDSLLERIHGVLEPLEIYSRGRFGGWRYEISNQDHAFMQGVEVVDRIIDGTPETTYTSSSSVNEV